MIENPVVSKSFWRWKKKLKRQKNHMRLAILLSATSEFRCVSGAHPRPGRTWCCRQSLRSCLRDNPRGRVKPEHKDKPSFIIYLYPRDVKYRVKHPLGFRSVFKTTHVSQLQSIKLYYNWRSFEYPLRHPVNVANRLGNGWADLDKWYLGRQRGSSGFYLCRLQLDSCRQVTVM